MNINRTPMRIISLLNALLIALCLAGCVYIFIVHPAPYYIISAAAELLALVFSVLYYLRGFRKDANRYYRLFMLFYAFTYLAEMLAAVLTYSDLGVTTPSATLVFSLLLYGNTLILAVGNDLGKTAAYTLCGVNVLFYLLPVLGALIPGILTFDSPQLRASSMFLYCTWLVLALNALLMTVAKYADKSARGAQ